MNRIAIVFLLVFVMAARDKPTPKVPVGKETTSVTGPLTKDGYIDYEAALNQRLSKGITPEKNANVLLWRAFGPRPEGAKMPPEYFQWLGVEEPPEKGDYLIDFGTYLRDHLKLKGDAWEAVNRQHEKALRRPWTATDFPLIAQWLKLNERPMAVASEAVGRRDYFNPLVAGRTKKGPGLLIGALLPNVQRCRVLASALAARAMLRLGEKNFDAAWRDLLACHRLGRLVARGGTLIEGLVGVAINQIAADADVVYLERARPKASQVQDCLRELRGLAPLPRVADNIDVTERFVFLDALQSIRRDGVASLEALSGGAPPKPPDPKVQEGLEKIDWAPAFRTANRWYDRVVATLRTKDRADREKRLDRIKEHLKALRKDPSMLANIAKLLLEESPGEAVGESLGNMLICLMMPAFEKVQHAADRSEQVQRNLQVAFALAAYQSDQGRYPAKLEELAPKYLDTVPGDIFSGKGLIYRPSEEGYLLYSVGVNGKDDGGRWLDDDPPGDDPRVRMPIPELKPKK